VNWVVLVDGQEVPLLAVALLGAVVGYVAGMFGIGGGFLLTPLLVALFGVPLPIAVGTGLCQMIGTSLVAFLRHREARQGEPRIDLLLLPGSLLGVGLGARALAYLGEAGSLEALGHAVPWVNVVVEGFYVVMLAFVAWNYWRHGRDRGERPGITPEGPLARLRLGPGVALPAAGIASVSPIVLAYVGLALGFLSGLLGIGGGVALNPVLLYGYGLPLRQAVGTGVLVLLCTAVVGTITHARAGHVHLVLAAVMLVGATFTAQLGALASRRVSTAALARIHALVLAAAIAGVVWDLVRHIR
jgi:uncharacterized protein